jgi:hypothetical protein
LSADQTTRIVVSTLFAPVFAAAATLRYFVVFLIQYARGIGGALGIGAAAEPAPIPQIPTKREGRREPAYPQYLFGQIWLDTRQVGRLAWRYQRKAIADGFQKKTMHRLRPERDDGVPNVPFGIANAVGIGLGFALAAALLAVVATAQAITFGVLVAICVGAIYLLRVVDTGLLQLRGIRITCSNPRDYGPVPYPSYKCPGCGILHDDVRPGRYGVIFRRCRCGRRFPTLLMLGSHRLEAFCPKCHEPLPAGSGASPEIILPVFGAGNAGKTQLMVLLALAIQERAESQSGNADPADDYTRTWISEQSRRISASGMPQKTGTELRPPYVLRLRFDRRHQRTLKIFDVAGEIFDSATRIDDLRYVTAARTFVFVLDPLAIEKFWSSLDQGTRDRLANVRSAREPRVIFENATQAFEAMNVALGKARLVVAVSKADLISAELERAGVDDDASVREWLCGDLEQINMVTAMSQRFSAVTFVLTAAVRHGDEVDISVSRFMQTALAGEGVR